MENPKRILCVCMGNSDRSPVMAAVLNMLLKNAGHNVVCESAGVSESAEKDAPAGHFGIVAAARLGLDISGHKRRRTTKLDLKKYDLIITASDGIAGTVMEHGATEHQVYNANIPNPWPVKFEQDYEPTMVAILGGMVKVVNRYFPTPAAVAQP